MTSSPSSQYCCIALASPDQIRAWTQRQLPSGRVVGRVKEPFTLDYQTHKPETDGLFCERTFGPVKSYACTCGKYDGTGNVSSDEDEDGDEVEYEYEADGPGFCKRCGVELTESQVRRHRMGYVDLACPIIHVWYLKQRPNHIARVLNNDPPSITGLVYYDFCLLSPVVERPTLLLLYVKRRLSNSPLALAMFDHGCRRVLQEYLSWQWFERFEEREVVTGADAVYKLLTKLRLEAAVSACRSQWQALTRARVRKPRKGVPRPSKQKLQRALNELLGRLTLLKRLLRARVRPEWMVLSRLPVLPPGLRPIVQLKHGELVASDLNDLYQKVIRRNNRLAFVKQWAPPAAILRMHQRAVQRATDALLANGMGAMPFKDGDERAYKSFSDILKGKRGRFRENLLGKRVDYSGRSVIVVGPSLALNQCGLPREMAMELFQPFVIRKLIAMGLASNIRGAKRTLSSRAPLLLRVLTATMRRHVVMLNRAPTLHRLGIQAFEPVLVKERAIHLHPLVCTGFNADFDGDQMAVHVPLSLEAQAEAWISMLPSTNLLSPASGEAIVVPSQDMLLGLYVLTLTPNAWVDQQQRDVYASHYQHPPDGNVRISSSLAEAFLVSSSDVFTLSNRARAHHHSPLWLCCKASAYLFQATPREVPIELQHEPLSGTRRLGIYEHLQVHTTGRQDVASAYLRTTAGRACFNQQAEQAMRSRLTQPS